MYRRTVRSGGWSNSSIGPPYDVARSDVDIRDASGINAQQVDASEKKVFAPETNII